MFEGIVKEYVAELVKEKEALLKKEPELIEVNKNVKKTNGLIHSIVGRIKKVNDKSNEDVENLKNDLIDKIKKIDDLIEKMKNTDYVVSLLYKERPELFKNPTFMIELIKTDIKYIIYDMTDDDDVYKVFASKVIESSGNEHTNALFSKLIDELDAPKVPETGKYKIPRRFLFEAIRKDVICSILKDDDIIVELDRTIYLYFSHDCNYSSEFGKKIEELYSDPTLDLYFAGATNLDSVFQEGYEVNYSGNLSYNFWSAHSIDGSFLSLFADKYYGRDYLVLAAIPKNDTEILGSDGEVGRYRITDSNITAYPIKTYLLPKYIIGGGKFENGDHVYIPNSLLDSQKKQYKNTGKASCDYVYYDQALAQVAEIYIDKHNLKPNKMYQKFDEYGFLGESDIDENDQTISSHRR